MTQGVGGRDGNSNERRNDDLVWLLKQRQEPMRNPDAGCRVRDERVGLPSGEHDKVELRSCMLERHTPIDLAERPAWTGLTSHWEPGQEISAGMSKTG